MIHIGVLILILLKLFDIFEVFNLFNKYSTIIIQVRVQPGTGFLLWEQDYKVGDPDQCHPTIFDHNHHQQWKSRRDRVLWLSKYKEDPEYNCAESDYTNLYHATLQQMDFDNTFDKRFVVTHCNPDICQKPIYDHELQSDEFNVSPTNDDQYENDNNQQQDTHSRGFHMLFDDIYGNDPNTIDQIQTYDENNDPNVIGATQSIEPQSASPHLADIPRPIPTNPSIQIGIPGIHGATSFEINHPDEMNQDLEEEACNNDNNNNQQQTSNFTLDLSVIQHHQSLVQTPPAADVEHCEKMNAIRSRSFQDNGQEVHSLTDGEEFQYDEYEENDEGQHYQPYQQ